MTESEAFLRAFHAANPAATSRALARTDIYARFAARIPRHGRILDLACGDGALLALLGSHAMGLDLVHEDLVRDPDSLVVQGRAQQLPFADGTFVAVACQLAFMLFDDIEQVVAELARVLVPGGTFHALLGGGPTGDGHDAFHAFAALLPQGRGRDEMATVPITRFGDDGGRKEGGPDDAPPWSRRTKWGRSPFGDRRASTEAGWRELFAGWSAPEFERHVIDLTGTFDEVWGYLRTSYQLTEPESVRAALRAQYFSDPVPLSVATYCASVTKLRR